MVQTLEEFRKNVAERNSMQGFRDSYEALAVAHNWRAAFGEDLPQNYIHPRDYFMLEFAMNGGLN